MAGFNWGSVDWGSIANAAVSYYSANQAAGAAKDAGKIGAQGAADATALQRDIYQDQRNLNMPFYQGGLGAYNQYLSLMGLPQQGGTPQGAGGTGPQTQGTNMGQVGTTAPSQWFGGAKGVTPNTQLYASDPRYRNAWDAILQEQIAKYGQGFNNNSTQKGWQDRLQAAYNAQGAPTQQAPGQGGTQAPMTQQQAFAAFRNTPGYQFGLDEGQKQLQSSASASGGLFSGKAGKALLQYGQNYADQQGYTPYMNRLAGLFGGAQTAGGQIGSAGQNFANQAGANMQNAANSRASGLLGQSQAKAWGLNQAGGFLNDAYGYYQNGGGR